MNFDELFNGNLETKLDALQEKRKGGDPHLYKVDLEKVRDKKKGWRSVLRFLPNFTPEGRLEQSIVESLTHYVNIKDNRELSGSYDSPRNFGEECHLGKLYFEMDRSNNAILKEKAKLINYNKNYYSYVLVLEDEQQPELVGKIMVFKYGAVIKEKIMSEKNGTVTGKDCNVFSMENGKDFVLIAKTKEVTNGERTYPGYDNSSFVNESSLPIYDAESRTFRRVPLTEEGKIAPNAQKVVAEFLLNREADISKYVPKRLTEEQWAKIAEIKNFMLGKGSAQFKTENAFAPSSDDFTNDLDSMSSAGGDDFFSGSKSDFDSPSIGGLSNDDDDFFASL